MKKRDITKIVYFLRGLGIGIIVTIIIVSIHDSRKPVSSQKTPMSKEEIIEKAKEYGLVDAIDKKLNEILPSSSPKQSFEASQSEEANTIQKESNTK